MVMAQCPWPFILEIIDSQHRPIHALICNMATPQSYIKSCPAANQGCGISWPTIKNTSRNLVLPPLSTLVVLSFLFPHPSHSCRITIPQLVPHLTGMTSSNRLPWETNPRPIEATPLLNSPTTNNRAMVAVTANRVLLRVATTSRGLLRVATISSNPSSSIMFNSKRALVATDVWWDVWLPCVCAVLWMLSSRLIVFYKS